MGDDHKEAVYGYSLSILYFENYEDETESEELNLLNFVACKFCSI